MFSMLFDLMGHVFPLEVMQTRFMQQAMVGLLLLAPLAASMGVHVVSHRMAFFSDAIGHSAFTGIALGALLSFSPLASMPLFAIVVGLIITALQRKSLLSSDTVIGVVFSGVIAFGLAMVSRDRSLARNVQQFLYGDILALSEAQILGLAILLCAVLIFQVLAYNRILFVGVNAVLAKTHRVRVGLYQYWFSVLLSLTVAFSVWAVGVLLVTALLVVPAAMARNFARSAGAMFWWATGGALVSAVAGLLVSAQDWARTATGATVILCACLLFILSLPFTRGAAHR